VIYGDSDAASMSDMLSTSDTSDLQIDKEMRAVLTSENLTGMPIEFILDKPTGYHILTPKSFFNKRDLEKGHEKVQA
jgi:hypothetical protein